MFLWFGFAFMLIKRNLFSRVKWAKVHREHEDWQCHQAFCVRAGADCLRGHVGGGVLKMWSW